MMNMLKLMVALVVAALPSCVTEETTNGDDDCDPEQCAARGMCEDVDGTGLCEPTKLEHCQQSEICAVCGSCLLGENFYGDPYCVAPGGLDCSQTEGCAMYGFCETVVYTQQLDGINGLQCCRSANDCCR